MIIDNNILKRMMDRFGVQPFSKLHPKLQELLQDGSEQFIKAPAGFEPAITGGGYEWDDALNGYRLGQNQKLFLCSDGTGIWVFKNALVRLLNPDSIQKWVSADNEYPMGKANAFFIIYGKLTGQDLGQNETAGDDVPDGETDSEAGGGGVAAPADDGTPFSKQDVQNMLNGKWPTDAGGPEASMDSSIPKSPKSKSSKAKSPKSTKSSIKVDRMTGDEPIETEPLDGPVPDRSAVGNAPEPESEVDQIIRGLYQKAKVNPKAKLSKQHPIRIDGDEIIDLYKKAKTLPNGEKLIAFLKSGAVLPLQEGKITRSQLETLVEHIVRQIARCILNEAGLKQVQAEEEDEEKIDEMTTTSGGGGSSAGTSGYNIPGAFARKGGSKAGVEGSAKLGYTLTNIGKGDMEQKADKLHETIKTTVTNILNENYFKLQESDKMSAEEVASIWEDDEPGEYICVLPDKNRAYFCAHRAVEEEIRPRGDQNVWTAINIWMDSKGYYPNIWSVNDHGNLTLWNRRGEALGGIV